MCYPLEYYMPNGWVNPALIPPPPITIIVR